MEIKNLRILEKGQLKAKFDLYFPKMGVTWREFALMEGNKGRFIAPPSRQFSDQEGKKRYFSFLFFDEGKRESFQSKVMELLVPLIQQEQPSQTYVQEECPF